jgi:pantoate--beta-alanine ligase
MSSRNVHLTPEQRAAAPVIRRALRAAASKYRAGERSAEALRREMRRVLGEEPLAEPDYVSVADGTTLRELDEVSGPALLSMAVRFGATRLIDNEAID